MKMTIQMPAVENCSVSECAYNSDSSCHAKAITVGDGSNPHCDTYMDDGHSQTHLNVQAGVGACKVSGCEHNVDLECMADSVSLTMLDDGVNCETYTPRH